ncbi:MAG: DegV family protein [Candidatus Heteroscillospira sp.]
MKIKISADSTCDLPQDVIDRYNIGVTPLYVVRDGESLKDGVEFTPDELYAHVRETGRLCSTAAVSYGDYMDVFDQWLREYDAVIHFTISSSMSACYQNACLAKQSLGEVYPVDSESLSSGIGLLVLRAAELAEGGSNVQEILAEIEDMKKRVDGSFVIETLEFLYKGGRCSAVAALGANLLKLRPCIELHSGAMGVGKKYRGALDKCITRYIAERLEGAEFDRRRAIVVDSGIDESIRSAAIEQVRQSGLFDEVLWARAGCTISSHCGPNTLGVMMVRK